MSDEKFLEVLAVALWLGVGFLLGVLVCRFRDLS